MLRRRLWIWVALSAAAALALAWALRPAPEPVEVVRPFRGALEVTLEQEGRTHMADRFSVSAPASGNARRITLRAGDDVAAGALLAEIEPAASTALDPRAAADARAALERARAGLQAAIAEREAAAAEAARAAQRSARLRDAVGGGAVTRDEVDAAVASEHAASARARAASFAADLARAEVAAAEARVSVGTSGAGRQDAIAVRAPISACVLAVLHESEGVVAAGQPLVELGCRSSLEIRADVLSADALRLAAGGEARIEDWGGERPLAARIRRVEPQAFTKVSALGVEEQRVWVILDFAEPASAYATLGDDYRVLVRFIQSRAADVLQVEAAAVFDVEGQPQVFVVDDEGRLARRSFTAGRRGGGTVEVVSGLGTDDRVVLNPRRDFKPGLRVRPTPAT